MYLLFYLVFYFLSHLCVLHPSHLPRQFVCLSGSEKGALSALTPHRGYASYPNWPLLAFKSRAPPPPPLFSVLPHSSASYSLLLTRPLFARSALLRGKEVGKWEEAHAVIQGDQKVQRGCCLLPETNQETLFTAEEACRLPPSSSSCSPAAVTVTSAKTSSILQKP